MARRDKWVCPVCGLDLDSTEIQCIACGTIRSSKTDTSTPSVNISKDYPTNFQSIKEPIQIPKEIPNNVVKEKPIKIFKEKPVLEKKIEPILRCEKCGRPIYQPYYPIKSKKFHRVKILCDSCDVKKNRSNRDRLARRRIERRVSKSTVFWVILFIGGYILIRLIYKGTIRAILDAIFG